MVPAQSYKNFKTKPVDSKAKALKEFGESEKILFCMRNGMTLFR
jgi:hypothetical protein